MEVKKRLMAFLCAAAVILGAVSAPAEAAWDDELYFLAINVKMMALVDFMPIKVGGTYYVPYTAFDANSNGGNSLGIYNGGQNKEHNTYTMYDTDSRFLIFELATGNSYDTYPEGTLQKPRSVVRNGKIYVSASAVCNYYSDRVDYTYNNTKYGYPLLRIKSKDSPLPNDEVFKNAANSGALLAILNDYYKTTVPQNPVTPPPTAAVPLTPTTSTEPGAPSHSGVTASLAFRMESGAAGARILDALKAEYRAALLLFTPEQLVLQDELVRRAVGEGHSVGLLVPGGSVEAAREGIARGNQLLAHIGRIHTRMILPDGADDATVQALTQEGYLCWRENINGVPGGRSGATAAADVLQAAGRKRSLARITMDDTAPSAVALTRILRTLREEKYEYLLMVETEF